MDQLLKGHKLNRFEAAQLQSGMLQIVLSHHYQKPEIISMLNSLNEDADFSAVRDTMYKYSKKAEDRFFNEPVLAFLFLYFATTHDGKSYT